MKQSMKSSDNDELSKSVGWEIMSSKLHDLFNDLVDIFGQMFLHENCRATSPENFGTNFSSFGVIELKIWHF